MTPLTKIVKRRSDDVMVRDKGKFRRMIVSLHPGGLIGLRLEKCRKEEFLPLRFAYETAIRLRVQKTQEEKRKASGKPYRVKRGKL